MPGFRKVYVKAVLLRNNPLFYRILIVGPEKSALPTARFCDI
jgi:hypothetical protein